MRAILNRHRREDPKGKALRARTTIGLTALLLLVPGANAHAATTIGQSPPSAGTPAGCASNAGFSDRLQRSSVSGNSYVVPPGDGVITSWTASVASGSMTEKLRVFTLDSASTAIPTAESSEQTVTSTPTTFPTRISVVGGQVIGFAFMGQSTGCTYLNTGAPGDVLSFSELAGPLYLSEATGDSAGFLVNIKAVIEPDADNDDFGDVTQDQCPTDPSTQAPPCAPPPPAPTCAAPGQGAITGTAASDTITGTAGNDVIVGLGGSDVIDGAGGRDLICGGIGSDSLSGGPGNDSVFGEDGLDAIKGNGGLDNLDGGLGGDRLEGGDDNDTLSGGDSGDQLFGQNGDDNIFGGDGGDIMNGGPGINSCIGGLGTDSASNCQTFMQKSAGKIGKHKKKRRHGHGRRGT
jgi:Ca2+-binding RTX toxin-like protein